MAFDGITTNCIMQELKQMLVGQRISKIAQPEREELLFTLQRCYQEKQPPFDIR